MEKNMIKIETKPFPDKMNQDYLNSCVKHRHGYNRHGVVHDVDFLKYLRDNYSSFRRRDDYKMYNLFRTRRFFTENDVCKEYFQNFQDKYGFKDMSHYILEYNVGSFAKIHVDNKTELTLVTLIDLEEGTIGGNIIAIGGDGDLKKTGENTMVISNKTWSDTPREEKLLQLNIAPIVADLDINETISYGKDVKHGVSRLEKGRRVVLIQWCYFNKTRKEMDIE
jgi:hypothetical protein